MLLDAPNQMSARENDRDDDIKDRAKSRYGHFFSEAELFAFTASSTSLRTPSGVLSFGPISRPSTNSDRGGFDAHRLGVGLIGLDAAADYVALHVFFKPIEIESDRFRVGYQTAFQRR